MLLRDENQTLLPRKGNLPVASRPFFCDFTIPVIMLIQISFFVFAWTFAGLVIMHKTVPLPDSRATWIRQNPSDTQVIVTLVSTVFALIGSSLLGKVVQFALVRRLSYAPLRLYTMVEWANLAQRSISLRFDRHVSWTLLSIAWVTLLGFLTTAWSTLLAPEAVVIYYDFPVIQPNFLSPTLPDDIFGTNIPPPSPRFSLTTLGTEIYSQMVSNIVSVGDFINAGISAALASASQPGDSDSTVNFVSIPESSYLANTSTGGIYPPVDLVGLPNEHSLNVANPLYQGLSRTINVTQQGFTANVICRAPQSNDPVITSNLMNSVQVDANSDPFWTTDVYSWSVNCSSEAEYSTLGVVAIRDNTEGVNGLLLTSVCFSQGFNGPSNQSFLVLFATSGPRYSSLSQICQVSPLVTTVQVAYDQTAIINIAGPPLDQHPLPAPTNQMRYLLWFPAFTIWYAFVSSQGLTENEMGEALLSFVGSPPIEDYLRGMVEYIGSFIAISPINATEIEMISHNGIVTVQTIGWTFHLRTHGPCLAAITLVTALTVAAGIFAMMPINHYNGAGQTGRMQEASPGWFNPTGMMDILLASSAGDLARVLPGSNGDYDHANDTGGNDGAHDGHGVDRLGIMLGKTDKGRPALRTVHMDVTGAPADLERRGSGSCPNQVRLGSDDDPSNVDVGRHDILDKEGAVEDR